MRRSANLIVLLAAFFLGACGSTTASGGAATGGPAPEPIDPSAPPPPEEGTGPAVTYRPVSGARYRLEHRDSLGTGSVITPGEVQRMSAGTGVRHSEYNASKTEPVHLLQIWIHPARAGLAPEYEQKTFPVEERRGRLRLIAAPDGRDGAVTIHQDATVYATTLARGERVEHALERGRLGWLQVARGALLLNGERLEQGDGAAIEHERSLTIEALEPAEALLFDLPPATAR